MVNIEFLLPHFIIAYLIINGIRITFSPNMIFGRLGKWIDNKFGWYAKPICMCNTCMASLWGGIYYLTVISTDFWVIPWCFALAGFMKVTNQFLEK